MYRMHKDFSTVVAEDFGWNRFLQVSVLKICYEHMFVLHVGV
jgi:hypothetical protein